jgi:hypothetical protein
VLLLPKRTALSRTSGENWFDFLLMAQSSQRKEPPQNPGRFRRVGRGRPTDEHRLAVADPVAGPAVQRVQCAARGVACGCELGWPLPEVASSEPQLGQSGRAIDGLKRTKKKGLSPSRS